MKKYAVVFVFDDKFIGPTSAAISSLLINKAPDTEFKIYACTPGLSDVSRKIIMEFSTPKWGADVEILVVSTEKYQSIYKEYDGNTGAGSITALLKFEIPNLLDEDIALYLDSDIIVRKDISNIFSTGLTGKYAGVVRDSGIIYNNEGLRGALSNYFNSGVLLLNLDEMRKDNATMLLVNAKSDLNNNKFVDQDAFNIVFDGKIVELPIVYNCLIVNLWNSAHKFDIKDLNALYHVDYSCLYDLYKDAAIFHYASKNKPWKYGDIPYAKEWYDYYKISPYAQPLERLQLDNRTHIKNIPIILATDKNYTPQTGITILSALENRRCDAKYSFFILTSSTFDYDTDAKFQEIVSKYGNCSIEYIKMGDDCFNDVKLNIPHITHPTFYRLMASSLFPQYEKMIYMDSDVAVEWDLMDCFLTDLGDNYIAGVKAASYHWATDGNVQYCIENGLPAIDQYVNAGMLIFNLKKIRENGIEEEFIALSKLGLRSQDQDVINRACYNHILHLPYKFNCMIAKYEKTPEQLLKIFTQNEINEANNRPVITHYAAETKPWADLSCALADRWWHYAKLSPYYYIVLNRYHDGQVLAGKKARLSGCISGIVANKQFVFIEKKPKKRTIRRTIMETLKKIRGNNKKKESASALIKEFDEKWKSAPDDEMKNLFIRLENSTESNNPQIYGRLARLYRDGKGTEKNISEAARLMRVAFECGLDWARREYVDILIQSGAPYDYSQAFKICTDMANANDPFGQCRLARMYRDGHGTDKDTEAALYWYGRAVVKNTGWAGEFIDLLISTSDDDKCNEAFKICKPLAEQGISNMQGRLARMYRDGHGTEKNPELAISWMIKATSNSKSWAGECIDLLMSVDDETKWKVAFNICEPIAESGNAGMQGRLARMYRDGKGVTKNMGLAKVWYQKAVANGNKWAKLELDNLKM